MSAYCTVDDVKGVLPTWERSFTAGLVPDSAIDQAIDEASEQAKNWYRPRYAITVIEAYATVPPVINSLAKSQAAILIIDRFGQISTVQEDVIGSPLREQIREWKQTMQGGLLLDSDGEYVPIDTPLAAVSNQASTEEINALFVSGFQRYG